MKINKLLLKEWGKNKNINPLTNRQIKINGPTYKKLLFEYNKQFNEIKYNYLEFRRLKKDPITFEIVKKNPFIYKYKWNPYNGEKLEIDDNGFLYFDPDNLINYYYLNRLNHIWINGYQDGDIYIEGYYGDAVGNGDDFFIPGRGKHNDWLLFRLPIIDEYLLKDHCNQSVTMGPKLTDKEIKHIYNLAKRNGTFKKKFNYNLPNLIRLKRLYDKIIYKTDRYNKSTLLTKDQIKDLIYIENIKFIEKLKKFK